MTDLRSFNDSLTELNNDWESGDFDSDDIHARLDVISGDIKSANLKRNQREALKGRVKHIRTSLKKNHNRINHGH